MFDSKPTAPDTLTLPTPLISSNPDRLGGEPCFTGTRVPVRTFVEYLEGGRSLGEFLSDFPSVSREHAVAVLEVAGQALLGQAEAGHTPGAPKDLVKYRVAIHQSNEGYSAEVIGLPGCWSQGATEAEAVANIQDAIREYLAVRNEMKRDGDVREVEVG